jgi:radial spoke head protein 9
MCSLEEVELVSLTGHCLSLSERIAVQTNAPLLLTRFKARRIAIWGKVLGIRHDYLIVRCFNDDILNNQVILFSVDGGVTYNMVQPVAAGREEATQKCRGAFMGDPAYEYRVPAKDGSTLAVKESERLSWFIIDHDHNCRVVPRGAAILSSAAVQQLGDSGVIACATFDGLDSDNAGKLTSYVHLRPQRRKASILESENSHVNIDFLDPISDDIPVGVWNVKYDQLHGVVYGTSQLYPGAVFFHRPGTSLHGNVYVGDGCVNNNICFNL